MANMCETCGYHWQEDDEKYPRCHFEGPDGWAPCEADEKGVYEDD